MNTAIILDYLKLLKENNSRDWFHANKDLYTSAKSSFEQIVDILIRGVYSFDQSIGFPEPKDCMFRINRDIRFSADKSPYKTNFGSFITKGGKNAGKAGYYFHLEPGECFVSGGIYMPDTLTLKAIRSEIHYDPEGFLEIIQNPEFKHTFGELSAGDKLKKAPRDFPSDFEYVDLLKYRSYFVMKLYPDMEVNTADYIEKAIENFQVIHPMVTYLNRAIESFGRE
jgi:uncharacterized protein (TIGR02453 family)